MSGQSDKKNRKKSKSANQLLLIGIIGATLIYIIFHLYYTFVKGYPYTKKQLFGFLFISGVNYILFKLINSFRNSYWESYLIDFLGLNLGVEIGINISTKFWYLYLIYPGYFSWWALKKTYAYVSNIGKETQEDINMQQQMNNQKQKKQKVKYVKAN